MTAELYVAPRPRLLAVRGRDGVLRGSLHLWRVEMRRALHRRAVRVLVLLGAIGCAFIGLLAFTTSTGKTMAELQVDEGHPALMAKWWVAGGADGFLVIGFFFLLIGALMGGATVAGAEWRAGTVTTVLTWVPQRGRLLFARTAACGLLATVIAFALQALMLVALLPATLLNGSTAGTTREWWVSLAAAMLRISLLAGLAAVVAVALATIARNTAFAIVTVFLWTAVVENMVRGLKPGLAQYLWSENLGTIVTWAQLESQEFTRGPILASATLAAYAAALVAVSFITFLRRDIAAAT